LRPHASLQRRESPGEINRLRCNVDQKREPSGKFLQAKPGRNGSSAKAPELNTRYPRLMRRVLAAAVICAISMILVLSTPAGAEVLFGMLQIYPAVEPSRLPQLANGPPAAIVILSAGRRRYAPEFGMSAKGTVDALSLERIRYGAYLARQTKLPVLVSGGLYPTPLATLMAEALASDYGIQVRWTEMHSKNTAENAAFSSAILKQSGVRHVILVTHAWHMKRAVAAFTANGMIVTPAPTAFYIPMPELSWSAIVPALATLRMSGYAIHELVGGIWYKVRYGY
jgi:uncharacterized SAM-binding protein YcdF (DUF218 family)